MSAYWRRIRITKSYPDTVDESQMDVNLCNQLIFGMKDTGIKQKLL